MARCTFRGCPVVFRDGDPRPCRGHQDDNRDGLSIRLQLFTDLAAVPGDQPSDGAGSARLPAPE